MRLLGELFTLDNSLILVFYITECIADVQPYGWICQYNRQVIRIIIMNLLSLYMDDIVVLMNKQCGK